MTHLTSFSSSNLQLLNIYFLLRSLLNIHLVTELTTKYLRIFYTTKAIFSWNEITIFSNILFILIDNLLPYFGEQYNSMFIKPLVLIVQKLNQVRYNIMNIIEMFTVQEVSLRT